MGEEGETLVVVCEAGGERIKYKVENCNRMKIKSMKKIIRLQQNLLRLGHLLLSEQ